MNRITGLSLRVADPHRLAGFYTRHLGMRRRDTASAIRLGYGGAGADLVLLPGGRTGPTPPRARYWKIGITLPNLDIAQAQLRAAGLEVSDPHQFGDIGYMCHLRDPEGWPIELLQHDFQDRRADGLGNPDLPLGGGAGIGQITLRSADMTADDHTARAAGLVPVSTQPVPDHGFTLHFYAPPGEPPPDPDLTALQNRPWLWRRPYTTLEFQHLPNTAITPSPALAGIEIGSALHFQR